MATTTIAGLIAVMCGAAVQAETPQIDSRVQAALEHFYAQNPANRDLVNHASAVLVFPRVTQAGAIAGGECGEGALEIDGRTSGYYKLSGASAAGPPGEARRSEVFLFMSDEARERFLRNPSWTVGAGAHVTVAQPGPRHHHDADPGPILAFLVGEESLIAGPSLEGTQVTKLPE